MISREDIEALLAEMDHSPQPPIYYVSKTQYQRIVNLVEQGVNEFVAIHFGYCGYTFDEIPDRYKPDTQPSAS